MGSAASGFGQGRWRARASSAVVGFALALLAAQALAQPVERNLPAEPQAPPTVIAGAPLPGSINDDRSLGANLSAIVILGPTAAVSPSPRPGVDASQVARLDKPRALRALAAFLGRPITRKLIGEVETAIVREYRRQGYPFVEVSTPEQEITGGSLQVRVVEFHLGKLALARARRGEDGYVDARIRTRPGDEIGSASLIQDLDWLNRVPYRTLTPTFAAGAGLGETDLTLTATYVRPWSLNAGYSNSGSPATGEDRIFVGGSAAGHLLTDAFLSVQVTGSPDFWATHGRVFDNHHPQYESVAGRLLAATAPRQDIELTIDAVETNEPVSPFVIRQDTFEATLAYRGALSNLVRLPGDVSGGVEWSRQARHTFFGDVDVLDTSVDVFQLYGDWSNQWVDPRGAGSVDVSVHGSPGRVRRPQFQRRLRQLHQRPGEERLLRLWRGELRPADQAAPGPGAAHPVQRPVRRPGHSGQPADRPGRPERRARLHHRRRRLGRRAGGP